MVDDHNNVKRSNYGDTTTPTSWMLTCTFSRQKLEAEPPSPLSWSSIVPADRCHLCLGLRGIHGGQTGKLHHILTVKKKKKQKKTSSKPDEHCSI